ncbi:hypothetical protein ACH5RR_006966 [Cinchona calisaya]|uniref:Uncharacterized protein n=1 Tax=Cinchona calisaya TaxID=153742 RepID=A0ABD3AQH7_9GENT
MKKMQSMREEEKVFDFLMGLDREYMTVRSQILSLDQLLILGRAYSIAAQEEKQHSNAGHTSTIEAVALLTEGKGSQSKKILMEITFFEDIFPFANCLVTNLSQTTTLDHEQAPRLVVTKPLLLVTVNEFATLGPMPFKSFGTILSDLSTTATRPCDPFEPTSVGEQSANYMGSYVVSLEECIPQTTNLSFLKIIARRLGYKDNFSLSYGILKDTRRVKRGTANQGKADDGCRVDNHGGIADHDRKHDDSGIADGSVIDHGRAVDDFDINHTFGATRKGFIDGCRPVIGVGRCHLRAPHHGVLLSTVGLDTNNCIVFAEAENKIRIYIMMRTKTKRDWMRNQNIELCPKKLEKLKNAFATCIARFTGDEKFEVATCNKFLHSERNNPEPYVDGYYTKTAYMRVDELIISPIDGPSWWLDSNVQGLLPPKKIKLTRRPKNARKSEPDEVRPQYQNLSIEESENVGVENRIAENQTNLGDENRTNQAGTAQPNQDIHKLQVTSSRLREDDSLNDQVVEEVTTQNLVVTSNIGT